VKVDFILKEGEGLLTNCQFEKAKVYSQWCREVCRYFVSGDYDNKTVECSHPGRISSESVDPLITPQEAADILTVKVKTLQQWATRGKFPKPISMAYGTKRYRKSTVFNWLAEKEKESNEQ